MRLSCDVYFLSKSSFLVRGMGCGGLKVLAGTVTPTDGVALLASGLFLLYFTLN